jgi:SynChlorMet cassette radical SAM/SPASM protein ScmE
MGMRPYYAPKSLDIDITTHCNLRCSYCSHFSSDGDVDTDLSLDEWRKFFKECGSIGIMNICLCGGEPFFRKDIREVIQAIVDNRMRFSALSNGSLIDESMAEFLKQTRRCGSVQVSIDGPAAVHDRFRGKGSFEKAFAGLENLLRCGVPVTSRVTLNKYSYRFLPETVKLLLEDLKVPGISTNSASYFGLCRENNESLAMNAAEYSESMAIIQELRNKYPGRISAMAGPQACLDSWRKMEKAVSGDEELKQSLKCGFLGSCGCVWSKMSVRADGVMVPCGQLSQIELGRINRDGLRDIWLKSPGLESMRKRREIMLADFASCRDCRYREVCRGGCPASAYTIFGEVDVPNLSIDSCYREFLKQGGKLPPEN